MQHVINLHTTSLYFFNLLPPDLNVRLHIRSCGKQCYSVRWSEDDVVSLDEFLRWAQNTLCFSFLYKKKIIKKDWCILLVWYLPSNFITFFNFFFLSQTWACTRFLQGYHAESNAGCSSLLYHVRRLWEDGGHVAVGSCHNIYIYIYIYISISAYRIPTSFLTYAVVIFWC